VLAALPADHVEVLIGSTVSQVPPGIASASTATAGTQSTGAQVIGTQTAASAAPKPTAPATAGAGSGGTGDAVTVAPSARFGIPCVY